MGRKLSPRLQAEQAFVMKELGGSLCICDRCGATLETYADQCSADLGESCPGFKKIEAVKYHFNAKYKGAAP